MNVQPSSLMKHHTGMCMCVLCVCYEYFMKYQACACAYFVCVCVCVCVSHLMKRQTCVGHCTYVVCVLYV